MSAARSLSLFFAAGVVGAFTASLVVWLFVELGMPRTLGAVIAPEWWSGWPYPRLVWGGIWGLLFVLPISAPLLRRGLLLALVPMLFQLFVVFPLWNGKGIAGLDLGLLAPLFVALYYAVWGVTASWWVQGTHGS